MPTKPPGTALSHRRVARDIVELTLRGTIAAIAIAALAMGLIAFAAG